MIRSISILFLFLMASIGFGAIQYISPDDLGRQLGYPPEKIKATDWTVVAQKKTPNVISSFLYEGEGYTFARIAVVIANRGTLVTPEVEKEIQESNRKVAEKNLPPPISKIFFGSSGYGYSGLDVFGPGGSQSSVLGTLIEKNIDFRISITVPSEPPLEKLASADSYFNLLNGEELNQKLLDLANQVAAFQPGPNSLDQSQGHQKSEKELLESLATPKSLPLEKLPPSEKEVATVGSKPLESPSNWWVWIGVGVFFFVICFIIIRYRFVMRSRN